MTDTTTITKSKQHHLKIKNEISTNGICYYHNSSELNAEVMWYFEDNRFPEFVVLGIEFHR